MIVVAGGTGFIGSAVVRRLRARGRDVAVMSSDPERSRDRIESQGVAAVRGDVRDEASLRTALEGAKAIVQALTFPTFPVEKPSRGYTFEEYDHHGTARLVAAAADRGVGCFVYSSGVGAAPDAREARYRAKWSGEEAIRSSGLAFAILRPSWVYGPEDRALNRFASLYRRLPLVPVVGDGRQRLQPVFVEDVAEAIVQATDSAGPRGTFEIGGPDVMTMDEIVTTMMEVMGKRKPILHVPPALPRVAGFLLQALPAPPLSPDAVDFLTSEALADTRGLLEAFALELTPLRDGLSTYLRG
ncbi:complex I NDUFA9 subunit family protein [soil metagenome]